MKYFLRDMLLYLFYGLIMGLAGYFLGVEARDTTILGFVAIILITIGGSINKHFPSNLR